MDCNNTDENSNWIINAFQSYFYKENINLQWIFKEGHLINVMGGYLTIPCSNLKSDDILFCTSKRESNNQKWKFIK